LCSVAQHRDQQMSVMCREEDVEAALERAGFKVVKKEMTATQFYFSRLFEAVRV
jgi:capsular polysaccharide biosynthesis protein